MTSRRVPWLVALAVLAAVLALLLAVSQCTTDDGAQTSLPAADVASSRAEDALPPRRRAAADAARVASAEQAASVDPGTPVATAEAGATGTVIDVLVRDTSGRAVAGVDVVSLRSSYVNDFDVELASPAQIGDPVSDEPVAGATFLSRATTGPDGRARLPVTPSAGIVVAVASDAWIGRRGVPESVESAVVIEAAPAFRLSGRVVHEDGAPVGGATVYVGVPPPGHAPRPPHRLETVHTDADGRFRCRAHPLPQTRVLECYVMAATMAGHAHRMPARVGAMDFELVAPRGTRVRGRCVDEHGDPLPRVRIRGFHPRTGEVTYTGPDGRFEIPVPATGGSLVFFLEGRVQSALRDLRGPPEGVDVGDVLIPEGGSIAGRVVDLAGEPLPGMHVQIVDPWTGHAAADVTTGGDGAFRAAPIGVREQCALVWGARPGEPGGLRCSFSFDALRAGTSDVLLRLPPGVWARVEIRDPLSDAPTPFTIGVVTLTRDDGSGATVVDHVFESGERSAFDLQFPGPGAYALAFELPVTGASIRRLVTIGAGPPDTITLAPR